LINLIAGTNHLSVNFIAVGLLLLISVCDVFRISSELRAFRILSVNTPKTVLEVTTPHKKKIRSGNKVVKVINDDIGENLYRIRTASQSTGFFRRVNNMESHARPVSIFSSVAAASAFLVSFVTAILTHNFFDALEAFMAVWLISSPCLLLFFCFYPLFRANALLAKRNCALIGEESVEEFGDDQTVIFNDTQDYMTPDWFRAHAHTVFIGPDGYGEGERAASLIASCGVDIRSLGVICTRHNSSAQVSEQRVKGVCDKARELFPEAQIFHIELDPTARIAPSTLAQRLIGCFDGGDVDCLYISSGVTHIACAAIEKIERRLARPLATFVIGHECSSADRRYLLEGRQRGYIKQDVYTQGFFALKDVAETCLGVGQLIGRLYPSSIFIR
jgi:ABC-type sugar transport system substrate-binding protein